MNLLKFLFLSTGVGIGYILTLLLPNDEILNPPRTQTSNFPFAIQDSSPNLSKSQSLISYGRWKKPTKEISFFHTENSLFQQFLKSFQTKRWHYMSINEDRYFIALAIVQLNYVSEVFLYVIDKSTTPHQKYEYQGRMPFGWGVTYGQSSVDSKTCTKWQQPFSSQTFSICYNEEDTLWTIHVNVHLKEASNVMKSHPFQAKIHVLHSEGLILVFPLGNDLKRPAYVHKQAGAQAFGFLQFDHQERYTLSNAYGGIDWTKSFALRYTKWKWASSHFQGKILEISKDTEYSQMINAVIGINLSKDVYDVENASQENAIWIDDVMYPVHGVQFQIPKNPLKNNWTISSLNPTEKEAIELKFEPIGCRQDKTNFYFIKSEFIQPYGYFSGQIILYDQASQKTRILEIQRAFGVVEDHQALW